MGLSPTIGDLQGVFPIMGKNSEEEELRGPKARSIALKMGIMPKIEGLTGCGYLVGNAEKLNGVREKGIAVGPAARQVAGSWR